LFLVNFFELFLSIILRIYYFNLIIFIFLKLIGELLLEHCIIIYHIFHHHLFLLNLIEGSSILHIFIIFIIQFLIIAHFLIILPCIMAYIQLELILFITIIVIFVFLFKLAKHSWCVASIIYLVIAILIISTTIHHHGFIIHIAAEIISTSIVALMML